MRSARVEKGELERRDCYRVKTENDGGKRERIQFTDQNVSRVCLNLREAFTYHSFELCLFFGETFELCLLFQIMTLH